MKKNYETLKQSNKQIIIDLKIGHEIKQKTKCQNCKLKKKIKLNPAKIGYTRLTNRFLIDKSNDSKCQSFSINLTIKQIFNDCK
jgi:hypothetical protein